MDMEHLTRRMQEKQAHEKKILAAAETIFCLKGYYEASMDEIAKEAQFTKRTVYQYFENKEELFSAVALQGYKKLTAATAGVNFNAQSGYEKLERFLESYDGFFRKNPETVQLIQSWDHVIGKTKGDGKYYRELIEWNGIIYQNVRDMIEEGKADGSIPPGQESEETALCLLLLIKGFFDQLTAAASCNFVSRQPDRDDMMNRMADLVLKPLKRSKAVTVTRKGTA